MADQSDPNKRKPSCVIDRRDFLRMSGYVVAGIGTGWGLAGCSDEAIEVGGVVSEISPSQGYVLVDTKKCQGCVSCMLACSLVHEGKTSLSLARLQVIQNSFEKFPNDVSIEQCRQCQEPLCVKGCPQGALSIDPAYGYVRTVDREKCVGCGTCMESCPYTPSRPVVVPDTQYNGDKKSHKCDLCAGAKYHWDEAGGGPHGTQACVSVCPVGAIVFSGEIPKQAGDEGYKVNLRDDAWSRLGYSKT